MIRRTPEPRLEPDHHFNEFLNDDDEFDADFIQPIEELGMSNETILDIYRWLISLGQ